MSAANAVRRPAENENRTGFWKKLATRRGKNALSTVNI
jgi:hypothetical protein